MSPDAVLASVHMPRRPPTRYEILFATHWPLLAQCRVGGLRRVGGPLAAAGTLAGSRWTWMLVVHRAYVRHRGLSSSTRSLLGPRCHHEAAFHPTTSKIRRAPLPPPSPP